MEISVYDDIEQWAKRVGQGQREFVQAALAGAIDAVELESANWPSFVWRMNGEYCGLHIELSSSLQKRYRGLAGENISQCANTILKYVLNRLETRVCQVWHHEFAGTRELEFEDLQADDDPFLKAMVEQAIAGSTKADALYGLT